MRDITIIGGGPAGAAAAMALARLGRQVLLIEQRRWPRDKVCGECLSSLGVEVLHQLGIAAAIRRLGAKVLRRAVIHVPGGRCCELILPRPMWGISRRTLDAALFQLARDAGAEVWQPARCEAIEPGPVPASRIRDLCSNAVHRLESRRIILADGKAALLPSRPTPTRDLGIKAAFEFDGGGPDSDAIELFSLRGHYGGLAPIENGLWNAAFSLPASRLARRRGDLNAVMREVIDQNAGLARRLARARQVGPWIASPLPRFGVAAHWPTNVIPIGNAAAAIEPIGGEGMGLALRSALLAAHFVHHDLDAAGDSAALRVDFKRLWRRRQIPCRAMAIMLSFPPAARLMVAIASAGAALPAAMLRLMGKSDPMCDKILPSP